MPMKPREQRPGRSRQDYRTPDRFLRAVCAKFGTPRFDLAATMDNAVCPDSYSPEQNSLAQPWPTDRLCWLNPPYANIRPWVEKASRSGAEVLMLLPASVGSLWYASYCFGKAATYFLYPRLSFSHIGPYPKDLMLLHYGPGVRPDYHIWSWGDTK